MFSDAFLEYHRFTVGPRYVFFSSLLDVSSSVAESYQAAYDVGQNYVSQARAALRPQKIKQNEQFSGMMAQYITMLGQLAAQERANEVQFVQQFKQILNKDKTGILPKEFGEWAQDLTTNFDYVKLTSLINQLLQDNSDFTKKRLQIAENNLQLIDENFKNASNKTQEDIKESYLADNYGKFYRIASGTLLKNIVNENNEVERKFQTQATQLLATRFNSILSNVVNDTRITEQIKNSWRTNWSSTDLQKAVVGVIMTYLSDLNYESLLETSGQELTKDIFNNFDSLLEKVNYDAAEDLLRVMSGKSTKTLEEVALTTRKGLGQMFLDLESSEQTKVLREYRKYGLDLTKKRINELMRKNIGQAKTKITKELGDAIRKKAEELFHQQFSYVKKEEVAARKALVQKLKKNHSEFFQKRKLSQTIENILKISVNGPSMSEFLASEQFRSALTGRVFTPGNSINLKTDASITFSYEPIKFKETITPIEGTLTPILNNWEEHFLNTYKQQAHGTTNVAVAEQVFSDMMKNISNEVKSALDKQGKDDAELQKILEALNSFVIGSISIKEYNAGSSNLGFKGGSLGPNGGAALENIYKMYDLGGITHADLDLLYFVLLNCGPNTIASDLKTDLENFLLGGAAMMMFDDGFAATQAYMERMMAQFQFMPKLLHLYVVQGGYVPASLVYTSIYNALSAIYQDITQQLSTIIDTGSVSNTIHINNSVTMGKYDYTHKPYNSAQARFDDVAKNATASIDIRFTFLAGILDIFRQIPSAFAL